MPHGLRHRGACRQPAVVAWGVRSLGLAASAFWPGLTGGDLGRQASFPAVAGEERAPPFPALLSPQPQVFTEAELDGVFRSARPDSLIVIDFFKTDCPACKVMAPSFHRLCKSASQDAQHVIFVKVRAWAWAWACGWRGRASRRRHLCCSCRPRK